METPNSPDRDYVVLALDERGKEVFNAHTMSRVFYIGGVPGTQLKDRRHADPDKCDTYVATPRGVINMSKRVRRWERDLRRKSIKNLPPLLPPLAARMEAKIREDLAR